MRFSERVARIAPSVTLEIDAKAKEMASRGLDVVGFGAGEPDFDTPEFIRDAGKRALDLGMTRYTPVAGTLELRKAICAKLSRDNGLSYTPAQIVVSGGAKHSLYNVMQALVNPGDEVIVPSPCWVSYPEMVRMADGVPVFVPGAEENDFKPTMDALAGAVTPRTRAIIINSPNNPNGHVYSRDEMAFIAGLAAKNDFMIISDEIYELLCYGDKPVSPASLSKEAFEHTVVVNGVSKSYAMTGWRIGYTACATPLAQAMSGFQSHATSAPASMCQHAAMSALDGPPDSALAMRDEFLKRRDMIVRLINGIPGLSCRTPGGAFYVMMNIAKVIGKTHGDTRIEGSMSFADALLSASNVAVVPGKAFEADAHCRLSYATSEAKIQKGLERIAKFVSELR